MTADLPARLQDALGASFTIERELGGGGMSRVFLAADRTLGRQVVVKVLPRELAHVSLERFQREIALAARLQHPHVVPLLTAGLVDGLPYYTMPFVEGESLRHRLQQSGELSVTEAVRLLREIATALAYAHDRGIVHRDLKPENVLLSAGSAMLTDFGVAKAVSAATGDGPASLTSVGVALGTPTYMAPEQAAADPAVDQRADLYAWGVLGYEVLTGSPPFSGRPAQALLAAHVMESPEAIEKRRPALPPALAALVMRCLEKRPADRPRGAAEIVGALDALTTPPAGNAGRTGAGVRPNRRLVTTVGLVVAVGLALIAFVRSRSASNGRTGPVTSLAVLPAEVVAGDSTLDYLADGLTSGLQEEMRRSGLRIAARASTGWFKGKAAKPQDVARQLDVESVLSISMRRLGNRLRVSAELYDAKGFALWNGSIERAATDPLALQDEVERTLVAAFKDALANRTVAIAGRSHTPDATTYDLYLRGRHLSNASTRPELDKAVSYLKQAIARDSLFAPAYAELAVTYTWLADAYESPRAMLPLALAAARQAVALDSANSAAHAALGELEGLYYRNWDIANQENDRAIALDSTNAQAHLWRAYIAATHGRREEAVRGILTSLRLDPLWPFGLHANVGILALLGAQDSALAVYARAREVAPDYFLEEAWVAESYRALGRLDDALAAEREGERILKRPPAWMVLTLLAMGRRGEAEAAMHTIESRIAAGDYVVPEWVARSWMALGRPDRALDYLERGLDNLSIAATWVPLLPEFRRMPRTDRYRRYLERANLAFVLDSPPDR